jgi:hypothetical protein
MKSKPYSSAFSTSSETASCRSCRLPSRTNGGQNSSQSATVSCRRSAQLAAKQSLPHAVHGKCSGRISVPTPLQGSSYLCGVADGIKLHVVLVDLRGPVLLHHRLLEELADGLRLLLVHGRLIGESNIFQHRVRIEPSRDGIFEPLQEGFLVPARQDVFGDQFRLLHVLDADVILAEAGRGDRLLVRVLAVDDARQPLPLVHVDGVPYLAHPGTRRVDDLDVLREK